MVKESCHHIVSNVTEIGLSFTGHFQYCGRPHSTVFATGRVFINSLWLWFCTVVQNVAQIGLSAVQLWLKSLILKSVRHNEFFFKLEIWSHDYRRSYSTLQHINRVNFVENDWQTGKRENSCYQKKMALTTTIECGELVPGTTGTLPGTVVPRKHKACRIARKRNTEWQYELMTRSQAVARIADRTAKNCKVHVT